ncbi:MAG: hypothetical protein GY784_07030, partial [Gammaproteobacteria bacterium]|nr:hypothetical protein [Gammaproteobacteria bacterium]
SYRNWFLRYGESDRPTYLDSVKALRRYLPEFIPVYDEMVEQAGGGDHAARFLSQYCPPPLFRGCSQAIYIRDEPALIRSYDYSPYVFDGLVMHTRFQQRQVIAMADCMSGVLDGINDDGLAVSMSFGGREEFGTGFGISLVLRYLLEFAGNVSEACEMMRRIPVNGAYNIMLLDSDSNFETISVSVDQPPRYLGSAISTNHQQGSNWPIYEEKVHTHQRYQYLSELADSAQCTGREFAQHFLLPPLYQDKFARGFGTLYDAAFYPQRNACEYFWPEYSWELDFDHFSDREYVMQFVDPEGYPDKLQAYDEIYTSKPLPILQF